MSALEVSSQNSSSSYNIGERLQPRMALETTLTKLLYRNWPTPITLKPIEEGPLPVKVWNPNVSLDSYLRGARCIANDDPTDLSR